IGWWGMLITMLADVTAYISLVFGYFFYFTVHEGYPPANQPDPAPGWTWVALGLLVGAGAFTEWSRRLNRGNRAVAFYAALGLGCVCALLGSVALVQALRIAGMDPTSHVYPAIVWVLVLWTV